ncbi:GNAT family N-acetyltransferase [Carboxylicivirga linearis]|uniref:GNAT family N-acetyltransferase n=1 Tax=Carboxylicivirga linearis TaxID=1628157 RepID=A0ABS5JWR3_9BACT|nr:GNAT family N-acetyltransferase [Carboxylicivirga linearis]MBS2098786.1 GNAT family N-acetyltransferase [Carboxylicivirga linearis]
MFDSFIRDGNPDDLPLIQQISDTELGTGYFNTFNNNLFSESNQIRVIIHKEVLVGFCYSYITSFKEINIAWELSENQFAPNDKVGVLKTIAVKYRFQKQGLGNALLEDTINGIFQNNATAIFTSLWNNPDKESNINLMIKNGFRWQKTIPNYWTSDSIIKSYHCPACGYPCKCSATIYLKLH